MVSLQPKGLFVKDVVLTLEVPPSVVYYWIRTGLTEARKVKVPQPALLDILWDIGIYKARVGPGYLVSTCPVRWVISLDDIQWLLIIKEEAPQTLRDRPRGALRALKQQYVDLMKGGQDG